MINFLKYKWLYFLISAVVIGAGIFSMIFWGFRYSIDFVGGTNIEYAVDKKIGEKQLKDVLKEYKIEALTILINDKKIAIRSKSIDEQKELKIRNYFDSKFLPVSGLFDKNHRDRVDIQWPLQ